MPAPQSDPSLGAAVTCAPAFFPKPEALHGHHGSLVPFDVDRHGPALWQAVKNHDALWTYMRAGPFEDETSFISAQHERLCASDIIGFAILNREDAPVGMLSLMAIRPDMRACEVGNVTYSPALQRTALGTEAQFLAMRHVFDVLGYRRYEWKCNALNAASRRAALRYGFTFEGVFRQHEIVKGRNRDTAWFSILDTEWPEIRTQFERWLSPDNFDAQGRQKSVLRSET